MKKVVAQKQIWHEYGYQNYLTSFEGIADLHPVTVVPFTDQLQPEIDFIPDIVMGSGRLIRIARERNWPTFPSFDPIELDIFDRKHWLNSDGVTVLAEELPGCPLENYFMKPYTEKLFTAGVVRNDRPIFDQVQLTRTVDEIRKEKIFICPPKAVKKETRFFVIGGQVVTGSHYKENGVASYGRVDPEDQIWYDFKKLMSKCNVPNLTAVVDVAYRDNVSVMYDGEEPLIIVELNNLNSSGVYATDYDALARALVNYG